MDRKLGKPIHPLYGMIEPVPEGKRWDDPRSVLGRRDRFSWCGKCGATWNWATNFSIPVAPSRGCFPVCTDCGFSMSNEEILEYLERIDKKTAEFYPMKGPKGELLEHAPMNLEYAAEALLFWRKEGRKGDDPSDACRRMPEREEGRDRKGR